MSVAERNLDAGVLRRHAAPCPRYTSYPPATCFREGFGEAALRAAIVAGNGDPIPRRLSLYVHVPFCTSPCFYCGCNRIITRDRSRGDSYVARLEREIELVARLCDRDREVVQVHFGGGTPNFLSTAALQDAMEALRGQFHFSEAPDRDMSIEVDPRTANASDPARLAQMGFNRISLGIQDFNPAVQQAVNRVQGVDETRDLMAACRAAGFRSVNVDLIVGLPLQTPDSVSRTVDEVVRMRPDRLAVYNYAHLPQRFKGQRQINAAELPDPETLFLMQAGVIQQLTQAGYAYIGLDHFALPEDDLARALAAGSLHRNFMGYTTHAECDLIGFGVSAISHVGDTYSQNPRELPDWERAVDAGRLPACRGWQMTADDQVRADLIQQIMCRGELRFDDLEQRHGVDFRRYFAADLARLRPFVEDGLVSLGKGEIRVGSRGRLVLRNIAMCFDAYSHSNGRPPTTATSSASARPVPFPRPASRKGWTRGRSGTSRS